MHNEDCIGGVTMNTAIDLVDFVHNLSMQGPNHACESECEPPVSHLIVVTQYMYV